MVEICRAAGASAASLTVWSAKCSPVEVGARRIVSRQPCLLGHRLSMSADAFQRGSAEIRVRVKYLDCVASRGGGSRHRRRCLNHEAASTRL
jgi:hypothetical protein